MSCTKKKTKKNAEKNTDKIFLKKTNIKKKEFLKEFLKSQSNNVLKKIKENNKLKSFEVDVGANFIKDDIERFLMLTFFLMIIMTLKKLRSLGLDKIYADSSKILIV